MLPRLCYLEFSLLSWPLSIPVKKSKTKNKSFGYFTILSQFAGKKNVLLTTFAEKYPNTRQVKKWINVGVGCCSSNQNMGKAFLSKCQSWFRSVKSRMEQGNEEQRWRWRNWEPGGQTWLKWTRFHISNWGGERKRKNGSRSHFAPPSRGRLAHFCRESAQDRIRWWDIRTVTDEYWRL